MMLAAPSSAAFVAVRPCSSFSISIGGYSPRQLRRTSAAMQYNSNASSSHEVEEEEEQDKGNTIIDSRQKMRRKHRSPPSLHRESMKSRMIGDSRITKHTINDELCPPTNINTLQQLVQKHITTLPKYISSKPIAKHNIEAFNEVLYYITCYNIKQRQQQQQQSTTTHSEDSSSCNSTTSRKTKVILDSGCGTGRSSYILGEQYKDCIIVGIDQSLVRLSRNKAYRNNNNINLHSTMDREEEEVVVVADITEKLPNNSSSSSSSSSSNSNVILVRAELSDFWYLCSSSPQFHEQAFIIQHYILYPNPYPKKSRLQHRFYAHPSFPLLMMTLDNMEDDNGNDDDKVLIVRSNWKGYLDEFKIAANIWSGNNIINNNGEVNDNCAHQEVNDSVLWTTKGPEQLPCTICPMTNFEAKFVDCGEPIYELTIRKRRVKVGPD